MLVAARTPRLQPPQLSAAGPGLLLGERKTTEGVAVPVQRVTLLSPRISTAFTIPVTACAIITIFYIDNVFIQKDKKKHYADTSLQEWRHEKHMVRWP